MAVSVTNLILSKESHYSNKDIDWVQYVSDHYQNLFDTAVSRAIEKAPHYWERYRLEDYLRDIGWDPNVAWIVLMLNQFGSRLDFQNLDHILLPDMGVVRTLWQGYQQYKSQVNAIRT